MVKPLSLLEGKLSSVNSDVKVDCTCKLSSNYKVENIDKYLEFNLTESVYLSQSCVKIIVQHYRTFQTQKTRMFLGAECIKQ